MFPEVVSVKPISKYKIWLKYSDETEGEVELSNLAGKGIFKFWDLNDNFMSVYIDSDSKAIAWSDEIDLCPDTLFLTLKGITFEDWKINTSSYATH